MFNARVDLSSLLVPLSGQSGHMPLVLSGAELGGVSLAERALPACRALDLWAARAGAAKPAAAAAPVEFGFGFAPAFAAL